MNWRYNNERALMKRFAIATALLAGVSGARGQITITSLDMFNAPGQYYRSYAADGDTDVTGMVGPQGGPQTWNFATGPEDAVLRFDYLTPGEAGAPAALFPDATLVERKRVEATGKEAFMFLDQQMGTGRMNYGYYDEATTGPTGLDDPAGVFAPPLLDFPESITYGSTWSAATTWFNAMLGAPLRINYQATAEADAYGFVILPDLGFVECLRVNELVETTYEIKFPGDEDPDTGTGGDYTPVATYYVRNMYWLAKDKGIVAQMTSKQASTPPPDEFPTAAQFIRMFETNHPEGSRDPQPVTDLSVTRGKGQLLLSWTKPLNARSFRVEFTSALGPNAEWRELATTSSNFALDTLEGREPARYYRIVSLP
jgi:hypothetical protein